MRQVRHEKACGHNKVLTPDEVDRSLRPLPKVFVQMVKGQWRVNMSRRSLKYPCAARCIRPMGRM
jgi:hypothetical protein